jgi:hypothetical protein
MKWLEKYTEHAYALLRIMAGFMFSFHGAQKILGILSEFQPPVGSQLWFGGIIELVGGIAVMLGFQTRLGRRADHAHAREFPHYEQGRHCQCVSPRGGSLRTGSFGLD